MKLPIPNNSKWLLLVLISSLAQASQIYHEFRECADQSSAINPIVCRNECSSFGASPSSFEVDANQGKVSEKTWSGIDMLTQREWTGCTVKDAQNWRCQTEAEMMGGVVRRDLYANQGQVFLEVSGSGGEQFYCSITKNRLD
ncbi:MAG: hypothetical protein ACKO5X_02400 [Limnohabitans sp.]